jgi:hypothetical protein
LLVEMHMIIEKPKCHQLKCANQASKLMLGSVLTPSGILGIFRGTLQFPMNV